MLKSTSLVEGQSPRVSQEHLQSNLRDGPVTVFACQSNATLQHQGGYAPTLVFSLHLEMVNCEFFLQGVAAAKVASNASTALFHTANEGLGV